MTSTRKTGLSAEPETPSERERFRSALARAQQLCASRECCIHDIRTKLKSWNLVTESDEEEIISSLQKDKFIDETRYASAFARDKLRYNKWGRIKIAYNLKMKSIPYETITEALQQLDEEEYRETAEKIVLALIRTKKGNSKTAVMAKLVSSMQSKGFEFALSLELIKKHL
ncbi:MAG: regulatory protein RecX [Bacteroidales bacterium]